MENDILISLAKSYSDLIPQNRESLLLIVWLYQKVEKGYINEEFEQKDLDDTIDDVIEFLKIETDKNKESLSKKLSSHFYITERVGNKYKIHLTIFAKEFCKLLIHQVQPELKKLELFHVFKRTLPLQEDDLSNIETFSYWFKNNFQPARNEIFSHTEILQNSIEEKINELRNLLKPDVQNPKELISAFLEIFSELENQTSGLINTIDHKNETLNKIKSVKEYFSKDEETFYQFDRMQNEIEIFFLSIDRRIISINEKIQLASKRLRNLLDTLKHKQFFKIKLEKLMLLLLKHSYYDKGIIKLPESFPEKYLPFIQTKFISIPRIDFRFYAKVEPQKNEYDEQYAEAERKKGLDLLETQELTAKWLHNINSELETNKIIEFDKWFDKILEEENNIEIPIQVCFGLIEECNKSPNKMVIIDKEEITKNGNLSLWKMRIQTSNS